MALLCGSHNFPRVSYCTQSTAVFTNGKFPLFFNQYETSLQKVSFVMKHEIGRNTIIVYCRLVSSVGRAPDFCVGGCRFKPRPDQHSGSLNN